MVENYEQPDLFGVIQAQEEVWVYVDAINLPPAEVRLTHEGWDVVDSSGRVLVTVFRGALQRQGSDLAWLIANLNRLLQMIYAPTHGKSLEELYEEFWEFPQLAALADAIRQFRLRLPPTPNGALEDWRLRKLFEAGYKVCLAYDGVDQFQARV